MERINGKDTGITNFFAMMFVEWKGILFKPSKTLQNMGERSFLTALAYFAQALIFYGVSYKIVKLFQGQRAIVIFGLLFGIVVFLISGILIWMLAKIFRGDEKLSRWLSFYTSAYAPIMALSGIPYFKYLIQLYGIYILYLSIRYFMHLSRRRSIAVLGMYMFIVFVLSVFGFYFLMQSTESSPAVPDADGQRNFEEPEVVEVVPLAAVPDWRILPPNLRMEDSDIAALERFGILRYMEYNIPGITEKINQEVEIYNNAVEAEDETRCATLSFKELCYAHIGKLKNDRSICALSGTSEDKCYAYMDNINFSPNRGRDYCEEVKDCVWKEEHNIIEKMNCTAQQVDCRANKCVWEC